MSKSELIRQAAAKVKQIAANKNKQLEEESQELEAAKLAMELASTESIIEAINDSKMPVDDIAKAFTEAIKQIKIEQPDIKVDVPKVDVKVPDIKIPEIKLPKIVVPEPKVTVNVPEIKFPKQEAPVVNFELPERISASLDYDRTTPLPVLAVDLKGNPMSFSGGGGGKTGINQKQIDELRSNDLYLNSNSSSSPLEASGEFTGDWVDTNGYSGIKVAVKTDTDGSFTIQWSPDGVNTDSTLTRYYRTNQIEAPHKFENMRKYVRVSYANGTTAAQSVFRLQTALTNSAGLLNIPLDGNVAQDYDSISVRPTDYTTEVALGRRQGASTWNKFGYKTGLSTAQTNIAHFGGNYTPVTTGVNLEIVSTSASDTSAGSGVQQAILFGVDENWDAATEVIVMDGTTTVTTTSQWIGINRATIYQSGASNSNVGQINVVAVGTTSTMATIPVGEGTTQQLIYTVPRNHQFLATWLSLNGIKESGGGTPNISFRGYVYSDIVSSQFEVYRSEIDTGTELHTESNPSEPFIVGEKSHLWFTAEAASGSVGVQGRFSGKLIRDVDA